MCAERARSLVSESGSTIEKDGSGDEWWTFHVDFSRLVIYYMVVVALKGGLLVG